MGNFVTADVALPPDKVNGPIAVPVGQETMYGRAEDLNFLRDAAGDLRDHTRGWVNARSYGLACDGVTNDYPALAAMLTLLGPTPATLVIPGPCLIGTSITIPATLPVRFEGAGAFTGTGAGTVTFTRWGGITPRRTTPDASDQLIWTFDEAGSPWASTGALTGAAYQLATNGATQPLVRLGLFANGTALGNGINPAPPGGSANVEGASTAEWTNWSISAWILPRTLAVKVLICKSYRPSGTFTSPFYSFSAELADVNGTMSGSLVVGGTRNIISTTERLTLGLWNFLGYTYDGSVVRVYRNGDQVYSQNIAGPIDYGTHGPWIVGNQPIGGSVGGIDAVIDEVRIANVVRPASYFASAWKQGMAL